MKLAVMLQGIVTLPKRVWLIGSGLALSCGAAVAMLGGSSTPAPAPPPPHVVPAPPVPAQATAAPPETPVAPAPAAASAPRQFLPQAPGESVVLDYSSQGCFGGSGPQRFEIRGEEPRVVRVIDLTDGSVARTLELDDETRKELERTVAFYRSPPEGTVCSTVDVVQLSFRQGDKIVWSETYEDSTCETDFRGSPWSLAGLFDAERHAERRAGRDERMSRTSFDD